MKIEQVMRTRSMNIHQVKAKKAYILVSCMVRIEHLSVNERYTEFILEDLNSKLYHYWALGHIHERQQLSDMPVINYSGNIQGRHFNEQGEKGRLLIRVTT